MSVIVKGMRLPETCDDCEFHVYHSNREYVCVATPLFYPMNLANSKGIRKDWCPLVELPEKHGRLIDADAFKADYGMKDDCDDCEKELQGSVRNCQYNTVYTKMDFCGWIDDAPTIIEAEGDEE